MTYREELDAVVGPLSVKCLLHMRNAYVEARGYSDGDILSEDEWRAFARALRERAEECQRKSSRGVCGQ